MRSRASTLKKEKDKKGQRERPNREKEEPMAKFISLLAFTKKGIENIKESPTRLDNAKRAFQALGWGIAGLLSDHGAI